MIWNFCAAADVSTSTVTYTESGTPMLNWDSRYLCHFSTEMAEIWSPGTFFQDVWTCKISALYPLYSQSYEPFSDLFSVFNYKLPSSVNTGDRQLKFCMSVRIL